MKIGFHALPVNKIPAASVREILLLFGSRGHEIFVSSALQKSIPESTSGIRHHLFSDERGAAVLDVLLSLGGDGTLLDSLMFSLRNQIPLLGINFGRLGFLPCIASDELEKLLSLLNEDNLPVLRRSVLEVISPGSLNPFGEFPFALNEVALIKKDSSSMIHIRTEVDGVFLNEYWGDGLIIASPTGSTGYSLSCGGPILWPDSEAMVLTPVSPHNLSMRPLVLSNRVEITLIPGGRAPRVMLSMDSRSKSFPVGQAVRIRCSEKKALFIQLRGEGFSSTLREKLYWGKDFRN